MNARWLLMLYPRAWRDRYGPEFQALLEQQRMRPAVMLDIIAGAIDARIAPQRGAAELGAISHGGAMNVLSLQCAGARQTKAEQLREALSILAGSLFFTGLYLLLKRFAGANLFVEAFGFSVFPIALSIASFPFSLKRHSPAARMVITGAMCLLLYGIGLLAAIYIT